MNGFKEAGGGRTIESAKLTQLWRDLCSAGKWLPESSPLVTHCQAELWELMRQIDIMMDGKQREWKAANDSLQLKLQARERDCISDRATVDQKSKEVLQLREQLANAEKSHKDAIISYTAQASKLRDEVARLKKHYEKMKARHAQDKVKATRELEGSLIELHRVQQELEEGKRLLESADVQRRVLQSQLDSSESQRKSLADKCENLQQIASVYQGQVQKHKQQLVDIDNALRADIKRLEGELNVANGIITGQKTESEKMRSMEASLRSRVQQLERELASQHSDDKQVLTSTVQRLESEVRSLTVELRSQGSPQQKMAAADVAGHNSGSSPSAEREIARLEGYLQEKDAIIRELVQKTQPVADDSFVVDNLRESIARADDRNRKLCEKEVELRLEAVRLRADCDDLRRRLSSSDLECASLREQLHDKVQELRHLELCAIRDKDAELTQIKKQLQSTEDLHTTEVTVLKNEIERLEKQLKVAEREHLLNHSLSVDESASEYNASHRDFHPSVATLEEKLRMVQATAEANAATLKVANSQLDAVRLENKLLKDHVVKLSQSSLDKLEADSHIHELQRLLVLCRQMHGGVEHRGRHHSATSLGQLEEENESLKRIVIQLENKLGACSPLTHAEQRAPADVRENDFASTASAVVGMQSDSLANQTQGSEVLPPQESAMDRSRQQAASTRANSVEVVSRTSGQHSSNSAHHSAGADYNGARNAASNQLVPTANEEVQTTRPTVLSTRDNQLPVDGPYQLPLTPRTDGGHSSSFLSEPDHQLHVSLPHAAALDWQMPTPTPTPTRDYDSPQPKEKLAPLDIGWQTPPEKIVATSSAGIFADGTKGATKIPGSTISDRTRDWLLERSLVSPKERELLRKQIDSTSRQLESLNSTFTMQGLEESSRSEFPEMLRAASLCSQSDNETLSHAFDMSCDDFFERPESASARFLEEREQRARELQHHLGKRLMDLCCDTATTSWPPSHGSVL